MASEPLEKTIDFLGHKTQSTKGKIDPPAYKQTGKKKPSTSNSHPCRCCGKGPHTLEKCPAHNKVCCKCKKIGHFVNCCFTKQINDAQTSGNP